MTTQNIQLSAYQRDILSAVAFTSDNLIIQACAGSGKTFTLELIAEVIPPDKSVLALAFNRSIAQEFGAKLPPHVECKTLHSLGLAAIRQAVSRVRVTDRKIFDLADTEINRQKVRADSPHGKSFRRALIGLGKLRSLVLDLRSNPEDFPRVAEEYDCEPDPEAYWPDSPYHHLANLIADGRAEQAKVDFADMLDHPLHFGYDFPTFDVVLIDEAQDLNAVQFGLLKRLTANGARLIAVGDRRQAIYGFRGADARSMDRLRDHFHAAEYPLSVCYRCGSAIVSSAQSVVGTDAIQPSPDAIAGHVLTRDAEDLNSTLGLLEPGDLVVCRINAPLAACALRVIRDGKKAVVRGRDIGAGLAALARRVAKRAATWEDFWVELGSWTERESVKHEARNNTACAARVRDQADTLAALGESANSLEDLLATIERVFDDRQQGIVFSSIHRAKGLEAERVVFLGPELVPHPMALRSGNAEALAQESHLDYVARTRAKRELIFQPIPKQSTN